MSSKPSCSLCQGSGDLFFTEAITEKDYYRCRTCELIWMNPAFRVNATEELAHYNAHENDPGDKKYRNFLSQLWLPLKKELHTNAKGLDYGSGPGPTLHLMVEEDGFECNLYDPYFHPDSRVLCSQYDFITCSETAEHFYEPHQEFKKLAALLKGGG